MGGRQETQVRLGKPVCGFLRAVDLQRTGSTTREVTIMGFADSIGGRAEECFRRTVGRTLETRAQSQDAEVRAVDKHITHLTLDNRIMQGPVGDIQRLEIVATVKAVVEVEYFRNIQPVQIERAELTVTEEGIQQRQSAEIEIGEVEIGGTRTGDLYDCLSFRRFEGSGKHIGCCRTSREVQVQIDLRQFRAIRKHVTEFQEILRIDEGTHIDEFDRRASAEQAGHRLQLRAIHLIREDDLGHVAAVGEHVIHRSILGEVHRGDIDRFALGVVEHVAGIDQAAEIPCRNLDFGKGAVAEEVAQRFNLGHIEVIPAFNLYKRLHTVEEERGVRRKDKLLGGRGNGYSRRSLVVGNVNRGFGRSVCDIDRGNQVALRHEYHLGEGGVVIVVVGDVRIDQTLDGSVEVRTSHEGCRFTDCRSLEIIEGEIDRYQFGTVDGKSLTALEITRLRTAVRSDHRDREG